MVRNIVYGSKTFFDSFRFMDDNINKYFIFMYFDDKNKTFVFFYATTIVQL